MRITILFIFVFILPRVYAGPSTYSTQKLETLAIEAQKHSWHFKIAYHPVMEFPLEESTGLRLPEQGWETGVFVSPRKLRLPSRWDWREEVGLTPVKNQGRCGSCWAFGTVGVLESVIRIRDHQTRILSEQQLVDCDSQSFGCSGGFFAFNLHMTPGAALAKDYAYQAEVGRCHQKSVYPDHVATWAYVGKPGRKPTIDELKNAIFQYGPVAVTVSASYSMQAYGGGVFDDCEHEATNHIVVLVGWDDHEGVWFLRNSWGPDWGENGYMRIKYGCNRVGEMATFVKYKPRCVPQPTAYAGQDSVIHQGDSLRLGSLPVDGQRYRWSPTEGLDDPSSAMPIASPRHDTIYSLKVETSCGIAERTVRVTVEP